MQLFYKKTNKQKKTKKNNNIVPNYHFHPKI